MFREFALDPKKELLCGVKTLERILVPAGFAFKLERGGLSSGGHSCSGAFVRGDRRLELHFRWSLGLVSYQVGEVKISHSEYLRAQGVKGAYPGFSENPIDAFVHLHSDLEQAGGIFLHGEDKEFEKLATESKGSPKPTGFKALGN